MVGLSKGIVSTRGTVNLTENTVPYVNNHTDEDTDSL